MKEEGRREGLFKDLDFPAEDTSLFCDRTTPIARLQGSITWLRPQVRPSTGWKCNLRNILSLFLFQTTILIRMNSLIICLTPLFLLSLCRRFAQHQLSSLMTSTWLIQNRGF